MGSFCSLKESWSSTSFDVCLALFAHHLKPTSTSMFANNFNMQLYIIFLFISSRGIVQEFGPKVGRLTLAFLLFSAGMFQSSSAFLPSSFSMQVYRRRILELMFDGCIILFVGISRYMCSLSMGAWYLRQYPLAILSTALSAFLSWPFAGVLGYE